MALALPSRSGAPGASGLAEEGFGDALPREDSSARSCLCDFLPSPASSSNTRSSGARSIGTRRISCDASGSSGSGSSSPGSASSGGRSGGESISCEGPDGEGTTRLDAFEGSAAEAMGHGPSKPGQEGALRRLCPITRWHELGLCDGVVGECPSKPGREGALRRLCPITRWHEAGQCPSEPGREGALRRLCPITKWNEAGNCPPKPGREGVLRRLCPITKWYEASAAAQALSAGGKGQDEATAASELEGGSCWCSKIAPGMASASCCRQLVRSATFPRETLDTARASQQPPMPGSRSATLCHAPHSAPVTLSGLEQGGLWGLGPGDCVTSAGCGGSHSATHVLRGDASVHVAEVAATWDAEVAALERLVFVHKGAAGHEARSGATEGPSSDLGERPGHEEHSSISLLAQAGGGSAAASEETSLPPLAVAGLGKDSGKEADASGLPIADAEAPSPTSSEPFLVPMLSMSTDCSSESLTLRPVEKLPSRPSSAVTTELAHYPSSQTVAGSDRSSILQDGSSPLGNSPRLQSKRREFHRSYSMANGQGGSPVASSSGDLMLFCPLAASSCCSPRSISRVANLRFPTRKLPLAPLELRPLIQALADGDISRVREAALKVRMALKGCEENKARLVQAGGVQTLVLLSRSADAETAEHGVTCLFNLCRMQGVGGEIAAQGGLEALVLALGGQREGTRENAAATLFVLSETLELGEQICAYRPIPGLVHLLQGGTVRGQKDAALALFSLMRQPEGPTELVKSGGVEALLHLLESSEPGLEDKAVAVLAMAAKCPEGQKAIASTNGLEKLIDVIDLASPRAREDAVSALLSICEGDPLALAAIAKEGVVPALHKVCQSRSERARSKAKALMDLLRGHATAC